MDNRLYRINDRYIAIATLSGQHNKGHLFSTYIIFSTVCLVSSSKSLSLLFSGTTYGRERERVGVKEGEREEGGWVKGSNGES